MSKMDRSVSKMGGFVSRARRFVSKTRRFETKVGLFVFKVGRFVSNGGSLSFPEYPVRNYTSKKGAMPERVVRHTCCYS